MFANKKTIFQALIAFVITTGNAHSWVEQLMVIAPNGTFVGSPGYARGNVLRTTPGFSDPDMVHLIPPNGRANVTEVRLTDPMCKKTQQSQTQTEGSPRLQANPGSAIALRFQENGHVTLPENQMGKPKNRGTVYVYGTTAPRQNETFLSIHKVWNREGTGGDKRGVLLSVQNFDDGRCYQVNGGTISQNRQAEFPHVANQLMGADLWCQQDIALPSNIPTGKPYTLYWVWDWPTAPHVDPGLPNGKAEIYTTCIDVDIVNGPATHVLTKGRGYIKDQSLNDAAIPSQFAELVGSSVPASPGADAFAPPETTTSSWTPVPFPPARATTFVTKVRTKTIYLNSCQPTPSSSVDNELGTRLPANATSPNSSRITAPYYKSLALPQGTVSKRHTQS